MFSFFQIISINGFMHILEKWLLCIDACLPEVNIILPANVAKISDFETANTKNIPASND